MSVSPIPFNRPFITGDEGPRMTSAMSSGHISGDGSFTRDVTRRLAELCGMPYGLITTSCTHALEMAALLLDLEPGDEVIMPSFTFVSTANAFVLRGAVPVFVDIERGTNNIDHRAIAAAITARTRAIVVVHYAGVACEMDRIMALASERGIVVIEDNAHGFGGSYRGRPLGSIGAMSTLSFHETKNIHCGEGGALLCRDSETHERAEIMREKGTNRSRFFRGQVDKYTWVDVGSSYLPSDLLAAFLSAQLDHFDQIQSARHAIWSTYFRELAPWAESRGFELPQVPDECSHPAHLFWMLAPDLAARQGFIQHLRDRSIAAVFHYVPLHSSPAGLRFARGGDLPVTVDVSERLVRLPLFAGLTESELDRILEGVTSFVS